MRVHIYSESRVNHCREHREIAMMTAMKLVTYRGLSSKVKKFGIKQFHKTVSRNKSQETNLCRQLKSKIRVNGPVTVADYMQQVLTNPTAGYYMNRDVFGSEGDFITSPEISQMFGELLGVWCVNEWMQCGSPSHLQVIELGPGRGTLADDMLRVFSQFEGIRDAVSMHLVEVSPKLSEIQAQKLSGSTSEPNCSNLQTEEKCYRHCQSKYGQDVRWYRNLSDVPTGFSVFIAHEFFDALPVHVFQKKKERWHELLIDIDDGPDSDHPLRFVLSYNPTVASKVLLKVDPNERRNHIEMCPEAGVVVEEIAQRIEADGGFALLADYGHFGEKSDTFRAFKHHKLHHPLCECGTADLTADVDFSYLSKIAGEKVHVVGPITQEKFLHNMGIGLRLKVLMERADTQQRKSLVTGYDMLTNPNKMGERFKFLALLQKSRSQEYLPAGFISP